jgi:serine/threonine protein kinase
MLITYLYIVYLIFMMLTMYDYSLSGGELFDRIAAEDYKMSEAEVIHYMTQVCHGLEHMHENSIVHLDIKVAYSFLFNLYLQKICNVLVLL